MKQFLSRLFILASLVLEATWAKEGDVSATRSPFRVVASGHENAKKNAKYAADDLFGRDFVERYALETAMSMPIPSEPSKRPTPSPYVPPTGVPVAAPVLHTPTKEPKPSTGYPTSPTVTTHPTVVHVTTGSPIPAPTRPYPTISFPPSAFVELSQVPSMLGPLQPVVTTEEPAFTCTDGGVVFATRPFQAERIDIIVGYEVEASLPLESYREYMEQQILWSILTGALECGRIDVEGSVSMTTSLTDELCLSEVDLLNDCFVAQTTTSVLLVGDLVDPPIARFLAFVKLQRDMETFHEVLFGVDRVTYKTPTLLAPPKIEAPEGSSEPSPLQSDNERLSATPWTIGSALVMCFGGMVSLWAWGRNRRMRNQRHMNHLEGASELSPDTTHPSILEAEMFA